ncbi:Uncharacterized conserved protein, DUF2252 family [Amycolatopsis tolypomycina]|uniref:Uncharacterized conserved protein, DUF2252 family n=1 Tax=Amycolatopsis tolypomycina TaxID=208445 RepID=A0A1H4SXY4_9PSEU|nr:DUF2252 domain-containing protein [Amycolatopsis tolypomycina]SEC48890.1 Uncharacterized conserved protein, DUF2252 family [Amycolatopsis tolypomycina]
MTLTENETAAPDERIARARAARAAVPPDGHAEFPGPLRRADPLTLLARQDRDRVPELRPLRYGRMATSPLAYFRGAALPAAADLALTPRTGFGVQACGDAQLANFGLFPAQGRRLVFDFADFGETLPAPWEWDVKRLAASFEVTGRENGHAAAPRRRTVLAVVEAYRLAMHDFARRTPLDIFFAPPDARTLRVVAAHRLGPRRGDDARRRTEIRDGHLRLAARPPSLVPAGRLAGDGDPATLTDRLGAVLARYRRTLGPARKALLDRYRLADAARAVTGPGDAGTRSWVALLVRTGTGDPLLLQLKEARPSVLQEYTGASVPGGPGRRVVTGQRLIQATGDVFLGWARTTEFDGRTADFHVRRLRDDQPAGDVTAMTPDVLRAHARLCGWTLARAHARTGDALAIAAYLGSGPAFAEAVREFAVSCANQNERDHAALRQAIRAGHVTAAAAS